MEKKTLEQTQIQVTLKQAISYIIAIVGMAAGLVLSYQKQVSNDEKSNEKIAAMQIDIKTNATQIETLKSDIIKQASNPPMIKKYIITVVCTILFISLRAQVGSAVKVPTFSDYGYPMWVQLPQGYTTAKKYPLLIFLHGAGERATNGGANVNWNDPAYMNGDYLYEIYTNNNNVTYYRENGWNGKAYNPSTGDSSGFIIVAPQWSGSGWIQANSLYYFLNYCVANYSVDTTRIYMTGLSAGGAAIVSYEDGETTGSNHPFRPAATVLMSEAYGISTQAQADYIVADSVNAWGFGDAGGGDTHGRNTKDLMDKMNNTKPGIARFTNYSGGHCCWNQFYIPSYTEDISGVSMNIYSWMLQYRSGSTQSGITSPSGSPTIRIEDQTIISPASSVTLNAIVTQGSGHSITSYSWAKVLGTGGTIVSPNSQNTDVTGLSIGSYAFSLTVTQEDGQTASDNANDRNVMIPGNSNKVTSITGGTETRPTNIGVPLLIRI